MVGVTTRGRGEKVETLTRSEETFVQVSKVTLPKGSAPCVQSRKVQLLTLFGG